MKTYIATHVAFNIAQAGNRQLEGTRDFLHESKLEETDSTGEAVTWASVRIASTS